MPEPPSIVTGVLTLLLVTGTVAYQLQKLHDAAAVVQSSVIELQNDLQSLRAVLEAMRDAFERINAERSSGHLGSLWDGVTQSLAEGKRGLEQLRDIILEVSKETTFLDDYRKQLRLNRSEDRIARIRVHIQSCRDTLQLSLQAIILVNRHAYQTIAGVSLVPNLTDLQKDVRRIAHRLSEAMDFSTPTPRLPQDEEHQVIMKHFLECVRSAGSVISDASTTVTTHTETEAKSSASRIDSFIEPPQNPALRRWLGSKSTVYEFNDEQGWASVPEMPFPDSRAAQVQGEGDEDVDSDTDLQNEMTRLMLDRGKQRLAAGSHQAAEELLLRSLNRVGIPAMKNRRAVEMQLEITEALCAIYLKQGLLQQAEKMLLRRMAIRERIGPTLSADFLSDVMSLAQLSRDQNKIAPAHLHARRALKGYRKLADPERTKACLRMLIELCRLDGSESDIDAYEILLDSLSDGDKLPEADIAQSKSSKGHPAKGNQQPPENDETMSESMMDLSGKDVPLGEMKDSGSRPLETIGIGSAGASTSSTTSAEGELDEAKHISITPSIKGTSDSSGTQAFDHGGRSNNLPSSPAFGRPGILISPDEVSASDPERRPALSPVELARLRENLERQHFAEPSLHGLRFRRTYAEEENNAQKEACLIPPPPISPTPVHAEEQLHIEKELVGTASFVSFTNPHESRWTFSSRPSSSTNTIFAAEAFRALLEQGGLAKKRRTDDKDKADWHPVNFGREENPEDSTFGPGYMAGPDQGRSAEVEDELGNAPMAAPQFEQLRRKTGPSTADKSLERAAEEMCTGGLVSSASRSDESGLSNWKDGPQQPEAPSLHLADLIGDVDTARTYQKNPGIKQIHSATARSKKVLVDRTAIDAKPQSDLTSQAPGGEPGHYTESDSDPDTAEFLDAQTEWTDQEATDSLSHNLHEDLSQFLELVPVLGREPDAVQRIVDPEVKCIPTLQLPSENDSGPKPSGVKSDGSVTRPASTSSMSAEDGSDYLTSRPSPSVSAPLSTAREHDSDALFPKKSTIKQGSSMPSSSNLRVQDGNSRTFVHHARSRSGEETSSSQSAEAFAEALVSTPALQHRRLDLALSTASLMHTPTITRKMVIVGDPGVGKTHLAVKFSQGVDIKTNTPTIFEEHVANIDVCGFAVELKIHDTAGTDGYDNLRCSTYPGAHVVLICLAIDSPDSLENVAEKWNAERSRFCADRLPVFLVGIKQDLRKKPAISGNSNKSGDYVTEKEGEAMRRKINALRYMECSALTGEGVKEVFETAVRTTISSKKPRKKIGFFGLLKG